MFTLNTSYVPEFVEVGKSYKPRELLSMMKQNIAIGVVKFKCEPDANDEKLLEVYRHAKPISVIVHTSKIYETLSNTKVPNDALLVKFDGFNSRGGFGIFTE